MLVSIFHPRHQCTGVPASPQPRQHLLIFWVLFLHSSHLDGDEVAPPCGPSPTVKQSYFALLAKRTTVLSISKENSPPDAAGTITGLGDSVTTSED